MLPVVRLNISGINDVMKSQGVFDDLSRRGERIAAQAGPGFRSFADNDHPHVARVRVRTVSAQGRFRQARGDRLLNAIDAGRG